MTLKKDDYIRLRRLGSEDEWCPAFVRVASPNGKSVLLELHGACRTANGGLFAGGPMPLLIDYKKGTARDVLTNTDYEVAEFRRTY